MGREAETATATMAGRSILTGPVEEYALRLLDL
jgi:hypothetical protein